MTYNWLSRLCLGWVLLSLSSAHAWAQRQLLEFNANPLAQGQVELELVFDKAVGEFKDQLQYSPNQLVIDVQDARSNLQLNPVPVALGGVDALQSVHSDNDLQLVFSLDQLAPYQIRKQDKRLLVRIGSMPELAVAPPVSGSSKAVESVSAANEINRIDSIDFRRNNEGSGQLIVDLKNASIAADIKRRDQKIIIDFYNTGIDEALIYIMDVNDFATPVESVEVFKKDNKVQLALSIGGNFDYRYDQSDDLFLLEVQEVEQSLAEKNEYQGKPISLNFQDIEVRTVLQLIADFNKLNLVTTDTVRGNITLRMDDVPWEQALDIILKVKGLDKRLDNNVLLVAPAAELAQQEREKLESAQEVADLAPLYSEFIEINYAKADELATLLTNGEVSMLSPRGSVAVDERTNTLLVRDTESSLQSVRGLIERLDVAVKQVVIEARMVTVIDDISEELGVRWGLTDTGSVGASNGIVSGSLEGTDSVLGGDIPDLSDRLNVNLPVENAAGSLAFQVARLANGQILDLELSALEQENKGEIIASPRITTANQKAAYIEQGREIPYQEATSSGATSVEFKKAVLALRVTPQITPDGNVVLDLVVSQDSEGSAVPSGTGTAVAIDTQEIGTQVLVRDGETIVLGGIYQQENIKRITKVPLLGDIPLLGALFRRNLDSTEKRELLIFVTPKIIHESI